MYNANDIFSMMCNILYFDFLILNISKQIISNQINLVIFKEIFKHLQQLLMAFAICVINRNDHYFNNISNTVTI